MDIRIPFEKTKHLFGILEIPSSAIGIVLFAHGSGSSRLSLRNQFVARALQKHHLATLLFDLLTQDEEAIDNTTAELRFNIPMLSERLVLATRYILKQHPELPIAYFGASTGAAAALTAAAQIGETVRAVVSRGGRPDLASDALPRVISPTLLIVGGLDSQVIFLNQLALNNLNCIKELRIIEGASHLFEENGKMELVTQLAQKWFTQYLS